MQICSSAVCGIVLLAVNPFMRADENKDSPAAYRATIATQQEEIKELKRKLSLARMEVQKLKHKLHPPKVAKVIRITGFRTTTALFLVRFIFDGRPGFEAEELPELKALLIRGDQKSVKEAEDLLNLLIPWFAKIPEDLDK
jgi:hypothetical protein